VCGEFFGVFIEKNMKTNFFKGVLGKRQTPPPPPTTLLGILQGMVEERNYIHN